MQEVPVEKLRRVYDPDNLQFESTSEVPPVEGFIGQERAVQALQMALEINSPEYNPFIVDGTGISRKSVLLQYLDKHVTRKAAAEGVSLRDFCYVHNFAKPSEPQILYFDKGGGRKFEKRIQDILDGAQKTIPGILKSEECLRVTEGIKKDVNEKCKKLTEAFNESLRKAGCDMFSDHVVRAVSKRLQPDGRIYSMSQEERDSLSDTERERINENETVLNENLRKVMRKQRDLQEKAQQEADDLESTLVKRDFLQDAFKGLIRECKPTKQHAGYREVFDFLAGLQEHILKNINFFRGDQAMPPAAMPLFGMQPNGHGEDPLLPFKVNILLDNGSANKMPVIFESNPTFGNLFGKIEKSFVQGGFFSDHISPKAGSLLAADGGYLVLDALDVVINPVVWDKLKKVIKYGYLKIEESPASYFGFVPVSLNPEQMHVQLKVILVGGLWLYQMLVEHDPKFLEIFKIKVELDSEMPSTQDNEKAYAGFISLCCGKEDSRRRGSGLLPFDRSAVAKVIEYGFRLTDKQAKLSTRFNKIKDLIVESSYWAGKVGSLTVKAEHVRQAEESQRLRANLLESKLHEFIKDEMLLLDTQGAKVGQINGLSVYMLGDYSFGIPSRITAETFLGRRGVVSVDREVKMSGPIHDKGVHIFEGYFNSKYGGKEKVISFSASICFEQSYHGVEGDSASVAELFCVISSLSGLPIKQNLAITGSVNQKGEIQPIGGVNQKIEGFFDVCKERGLAGDQGVVIPHQNVQNLMLREDVVEACREGKFRVHAIKTVDDGLELLVGVPASEIHQLVSACLADMTKKIQESKKEAPNAS